jgi:hypothetical protein
MPLVMVDFRFRKNRGTKPRSSSQGAIEKANFKTEVSSPTAPIAPSLAESLSRGVSKASAIDLGKNQKLLSSSELEQRSNRL